MNTDPSDRPLRRHALGLWFCGLGVLGLVRLFMRVAREGTFGGSAQDWLWLTGSIGVLAIGLMWIVRNRSGRH